MCADCRQGSSRRPIFERGRCLVSIETINLRAAQAEPDETMHGRSEFREIRRLVAEHYAFLWRCLRHLGVPLSEADEVAQQVVDRMVNEAAAARFPPLGSGERTQTRAQLERAVCLAIVMQVAAAWRALHPPASDVEKIRSTLRVLARERSAGGALPPSRALLDLVLEEMTLEMRAVFMLYEIEQFSIPEIAHLLDWPSGRVALWLSHARTYFRNTVGRLMPMGSRREGAR